MLRYDFSRQRIDIKAPIPKNLNAVMAMDHDSIGSDLERAGLPRLQRRNEFLASHLGELIQF